MAIKRKIEKGKNNLLPITILFITLLGIIAGNILLKDTLQTRSRADFFDSTPCSTDPGSFDYCGDSAPFRGCNSPPAEWLCMCRLPSGKWWSECSVMEDSENKQKYINQCGGDQNKAQLQWKYDVALGETRGACSCGGQNVCPLAQPTAPVNPTVNPLNPTATPVNPTSEPTVYLWPTEPLYTITPRPYSSPTRPYSPYPTPTFYFPPTGSPNSSPNPTSGTNPTTTNPTNTSITGIQPTTDNPQPTTDNPQPTTTNVKPVINLPNPEPAIRKAIRDTGNFIQKVRKSLEDFFRVVLP